MSAVSRSMCKIVIPIFALFITAVATYTIYIEKQAQTIIKDLDSMKIVEDPLRFALLKRKYGRQLKQDDGCTPAHCSYAIEITNQLLAALHLSNYVELTTTFHFDRGFLYSMMTDYRVALPNGISPVVHVHEDPCQGTCPEWFRLGVNPHGPRSSDLWNGIAEFNATVSPEERNAVRSFIWLPFPAHPLQRHRGFTPNGVEA